MLSSEERLAELEKTQRATINILDDLHEEKRRFEATQEATYNILEDLNEERGRARALQQATVNVLDDLRLERDRLDEMQRATLNILEDFDAEKEKAASLAEKEVLLKEVHHRVKNNLQVIAALLTLQSAPLSDGWMKSAFEESRNRILSMALVHETLYRGHDLARIDFGVYIDRLCNAIFHSAAASTRGIELKLDVEPATFPIDTAIPLGLILNELVSNTLKHAFPGGRRGRVTVSLHRNPDGTHDLAVHDDGIGIPHAIDPAKATTLGLRLVHGLAGQLSASLHITSTPSVTVTLRIPSSIVVKREQSARVSA